MNEKSASAGEIRLLVADDHAMVLEMIGMFLEQAPDISVTTGASLDEAVAHVEKSGPFDLVLLDLDMPGMAGSVGLARAIEANGSKPVAILTGNPSPRKVDELLADGAAGVVLKTTSLRSLANAVRFMAAGEKYVPMELMQERNRSQAALAVPLSERELMVLEHLSEGQPNREIGKALGLGEPTIKMHVKSICKKLGVSNRTQAVIVSRDLKLI